MKHATRAARYMHQSGDREDRSEHQRFSRRTERSDKEYMQPAKLLLSQSIGFIAIIALSWMNELFGLRSLILGDHPYISDFRESTLEMLFVLVVWLLVVRSSSRMLTRMRHLESFTRICSWCRRIGCEGSWMPLEQFLSRNFDAPTTHGICEECMDKQRTAIACAERLRSESSPLELRVFPPMGPLPISDGPPADR